MSNVIQFPTVKTKVHILKFKCPAIVKMSKEPNNDITLELNRISETHSQGTAWIPAVNVTEAKKKLHKLLQVSEWID